MSALISENAQLAAKTIFDSLKNSLLCATIAVAGMAIVQNPKLSPVGPEFAPWLGGAIILLSAFLFLWNFFLTVVAIHKKPKVRTWAFWIINFLAVAPSLIITLSFYGAAVSLQSKQIQSISAMSQVQAKP